MCQAEMLQDSILSPLFFLIFYNCLFDKMVGMLIRFADAGKLGMITNTLEEEIKLKMILKN